ncbi:lysylphosphatidylglycerol synthase domain-containing protein [Crocosphaera sp. UHCC 0190]|uniref:lysylphosphatidylglycerol synthase domain-containing protein n=1 Tax=Crocosphaera sp. UHCC 0190 TaxID=3110246 RepID=UPI002B1FD107|nr:lysylphosphatidylglycerol synthase domain-containing protein [Crocosphaera sp. UHCC 0190]MEA5510237.1 lysylphosphatidylglycerol synthase domain-containing protein [Crocosphaera sp. UHCC 0190]
MHKKNLFRLIPSCLSLVLFGLSIWTIQQNLQNYQADTFWQTLSKIPHHHILWAIALMSINYLIMTGYDFLGVAYVRRSIPYSKTALVGIICSGISNSVGFALLSSCMIRYRFYSAWGLSVVAIAQISAFCNLSFCLGLFVVGAIVFLKEPLAIPNLLDLPFISVRPLGLIFLLIIVAYLFLTVARQKPLIIGKWTLPHLPVRLALGQLLVSALDWSLAAAVFYAILSASVSLPYSTFFGIYMLAQVAGLASNVPGGLGVFETVMILLLSSFISSEELLGSLLIYRGVYYFIPLTVSAVLLGKYELGRFLGNKSSSWAEVQQ